MILVKTRELTGAALDWAVAKCEGFTEFTFWHTGAVTTRFENGVTRTHSYSTNWAQGGPILERENIGFISEARDGTVWKAQYNYLREVLFKNPVRLANSYCTSRGPTCLIAAMRCYVLSKLGNEVQVPDELV